MATIALRSLRPYPGPSARAARVGEGLAGVHGLPASPTPASQSREINPRAASLSATGETVRLDSPCALAGGRKRGALHYVIVLESNLAWSPLGLQKPQHNPCFDGVGWQHCWALFKLMRPPWIPGRAPQSHKDRRRLACKTLAPERLGEGRGLLRGWGGRAGGGPSPGVL